MILYIVSAAALVIVLLIALVFHAKSKGLYDGYLEGLDKKEWSLRDFLPIGFYISGLGFDEKLAGPFHEKYVQYKHRVYLKTLILYGKRRGAEQMYYVYQANKAVLSLLILLMIAVFAPLGALSNEDTSIIWKLWGLGLVGAIGLPFLVDYGLDEKLKKRRDALMMQFPSFGSKLVLLVEAGMTVPKAIRKIVADSPEQTLLMCELGDMLSEVEGGVAESAAYEEFARRCGIKEINRFISVLVQSMKKGSQNMALTLKIQIQECWRARKELALVLGQQASTRLVLPLMLMMVAIIMMVGGPALMMFSQI